MDVLVLLVFGTVFCAVVIGILIGRVTLRNELNEKIEQAFHRGQQEAEVEKANIALELGHQLIKMRDSIQLAAEAYESTVQVVRDRLANSVELIGATEAEKLLLNPGDIQLSLQFEKGNHSTPADEPLKVETVSENGSQANGRALDEEQNEFAERATARDLDAELERADLPIQ